MPHPPRGSPDALRPPHPWSMATRQAVSKLASIARTLARLVPPVLLAGFAFALLLVFTGAFVSHAYFAAIREATEQVARTQENLATLDDLERQSAYALAAARIFCIAPFEDNRRSYESAADAARHALATLQQTDDAAFVLDRAVGNVTEAHLATLDRLMSGAGAGSPFSSSTAFDNGDAALSMLALSTALNRERARLDELLSLRRAEVAAQVQHAELANVASAAASIVMLLVFGWLMTGFLRQRNRAAKALREVNADLEQHIASRTTELEALSRHLLNVREDERAALAREIHDQIGSEISTIIIDSSQIEALVRAGHAVPDSVWTRLKATLREMTTAHRRIINALHPAVLDHLGLAPAIAALLADVRERSRLQAALSVEGDLDDLPDGLAIAVYRIVQEAVTNVVRHARARRLHARLRRTSGFLAVEVSDDGVGISPDGRVRGRLGLLGMSERARNLGGTLRLSRGRGNRGTCVSASFPIKPQPRARP